MEAVATVVADGQGRMRLSLPTVGMAAGCWSWRFQGTASRHQALAVLYLY